LTPIVPELDVIGNITLNKGTILNSNIFATGNGEFDDRSEINGNVHVNGTLSMNASDGSCAKIDENAFVGGNVTLGGDSHIGGTLITGGNCFAPKGLSSYVAGSVTQNEAPSPISITATSSLNTPVALPDGAATYSDVPLTNIVPANKKNITSATISSSGILDLSGYNFYNKSGDDNDTDTNTDNATITVDTSTQDINLIINSTLELNNLNIETTSPNHNLYIYLNFDSTQHFWLNGSSYIGPSNQNATQSNVFVFGNNQFMDLRYNSSMFATVFIPNGVFKLDTHGVYINNSDEFHGSADVNNVVITSTNSAPIVYSQPDIDGTPLATVVYGSNWIVTWNS
jgi:hypothetical protein